MNPSIVDIDNPVTISLLPFMILPASAMIANTNGQTISVSKNMKRKNLQEEEQGENTIFTFPDQGSGGDTQSFSNTPEKNTSDCSNGSQGQEAENYPVLSPMIPRTLDFSALVSECAFFEKLCPEKMGKLPNTTALDEFATKMANTVLAREVIFYDSHENDHHNTSHVPFDPNCVTCQLQAGRARKHVKTSHSKVGSISVDLVTLNDGPESPGCIVGYTKSEEGAHIYTCCPLKDKTLEKVRHGILKSILVIEQIWKQAPVHRVHGDREKSFESLIEWFENRFTSFSTTAGHDPQSNGLAENAIGSLVRVARRNLEYIEDKFARKKLWCFAMVHASYALTAVQEDKLPREALKLSEVVPFGALIMYREPWRNNDGSKSAASNRMGIFLYPSDKVPSGAVVVPLSLDSANYTDETT